MATFMEKFTDQTYALMRMVTGFLFLFHGTQKLLDFPKPVMEGIPAFIQYGAGGIELIGGLLVMLGLFTRWSAFLCSGLMAVAYWMAHGTQALWPMLNGGELAIMWCFVFLYVSSRGPGVWSLDGLRSSA